MERKKNKKCFRPNLDLDGTLGSIIKIEHVMQNKDIIKMVEELELLS